MLEESLKAVNIAAHKTAASMTADIRQSALENGWHPDVVNHMHVKYEDGGFSVHVEPEYEQRAHIHEYGTEGVRPTAVIRNYDTSTGHRVHLDKHLTAELRK